MNITEFRQRREALEVPARPIKMDGQLLYALPLDVIDARTVAARQLLDRWQECDNPKCRDGYLGEHVWEADDNYGGTVEYRQLEPCPSCGGSGVLPNQARLEAAIEAAAEEYTFATDPIPPRRWVDLPLVDQLVKQTVAKSIYLAAVRAFDKETE